MKIVKPRGKWVFVILVGVCIMAIYTFYFVLGVVLNIIYFFGSFTSSNLFGRMWIIHLCLLLVVVSSLLQSSSSIIFGYEIVLLLLCIYLDSFIVIIKVYALSSSIVTHTSIDVYNDEHIPFRYHHHIFLFH